MRPPAPPSCEVAHYFGNAWLASPPCCATSVVYARWEREAVRYGKVVKDRNIKQR